MESIRLVREAQMKYEGCRHCGWYASHYAGTLLARHCHVY